MVIKDNTFKYNRGTEAEILINVYDPDGNEVTTSEGLSYVTVDGVSGFDVTEASGIFQMANDYAISTTSSTTGTIQEWKVKITYLNKEYDQTSNIDKVFEGELVLQKEEYTMTAVAIYSADDFSFRFYKASDALNVGDVYNGLTVSSVYNDVENIEPALKEEYVGGGHYEYYPGSVWSDLRYAVEIVVVEDVIKPVNTAYWFDGFQNVDEMYLEKMDTSNTTTMAHMFDTAGLSGNVDGLVLHGLENWDVSKVTDMSYMFHSDGLTYHLINMNISNWNTANVTNMASMFYRTNSSEDAFEFDLSGWDTSKVTDMSYMFGGSGQSASVWNAGDLSNWDVSNVTDMSQMFADAGYYANNFRLDLSRWNVSSVTDMYNMFAGAGYNSTDFQLDLSGWNVSSVTDMSSMFQSAGCNATTWGVGDISAWNTAAVTDMSFMFYEVGVNADFTLDLSGWNVDNVTDSTSFCLYAGGTIYNPSWVY